MNIGAFDVTLVTYYSERTLEPLLESLLKQELGPERIHLFVVDNASADHTIDILRAWQETNASRLAANRPYTKAEDPARRAGQPARGPHDRRPCGLN